MKTYADPKHCKLAFSSTSRKGFLAPVLKEPAAYLAGYPAEISVSGQILDPKCFFLNHVKTSVFGIVL